MTRHHPSWGISSTPAVRRLALDTEEHAEEAVRERLVATHRAAVEAPECGENKAARIELDHRREVAYVALLVTHAIRRHIDAGSPGIRSAGDPHADGKRLGIQCNANRSGPDAEHERNQQVGNVAMQTVF